MTLRRLLLCLLLLASAGFARADAPLTDEAPARFFIERIDVRNATRVSRDVVIAESRLREGATYSEQELREASLRVNRAPYLISADFSLEKGSERGKYVLVMTLNETRPFFFLLDGVFYVARDNHARLEYPSVLSSDNDIAAGFRFFVGPRGAIHFGIEGVADNRSYTSDYVTFAIGYTEYDLFGTRAFATVNIKKPFGVGGPHPAPQVVLGIPLSPNQTMTLDYDQTEFGGGDDLRSQSQRIFTARWSYNTTNHPVLPTQGTVLTVTPVAVWNHVSGFDVGPHAEHIPYATRQRSYGLEATAQRYWELTERDSVYAGVGAGVARTFEHGVQPLYLRGTPETVDSSFGIFDAGIAHSFWSPERVAKDGESRVQFDVHYGRRVDERFGEFFFRKPESREAALSWVRRNAWGTLRLGAGYSW